MIYFQARKAQGKRMEPNRNRVNALMKIFQKTWRLTARARTKKVERKRSTSKTKALKARVTRKTRRRTAMLIRKKKVWMKQIITGKPSC